MIVFPWSLMVVSPVTPTSVMVPPAQTLEQPQIVAQAITPAPDGTQTLVTPAPVSCNGGTCNDAVRFDITGGQVSADQRNLFHSFLEFNLSENQIANFLANPGLENILSRVIGNQPSLINGLIQVTGGNPNLFLMNPSGVIFGPNAQLNVPASFTVTTANGIGFGNNTWFNAIGNPDWANLVGTPHEFRFDSLNPGTLSHAGTLAVMPGQNITFIGGSVSNTGTLSAPGGTITIASVPGESLVRISQPGHILSLEVASVSEPSLDSASSSLSLPELLTGKSPQDDATTVNLINGQMVLTTGTTLSAGTLDVSHPTQGAGGTINLLGSAVQITDGVLNASGLEGGGIIRIGGDWQGQGQFPRAQTTTVAPGTAIFANALERGAGGQVVIWGEQTTQFSGSVTAQGESRGGMVEVSGKEQLIFRGEVDVTARSGIPGTLLLDPTDITIVATEGVDDGSIGDDNTIAVNDDVNRSYTISQQTLESLQGNILLEASNNITIENGISLTFNNPGNDITFTADADQTGEGNFLMDVNEAIIAPSSNVTVNGASIIAGEINTFAADLPGGNITLNATNGNVTTRFLDSSSDFSAAGNISIQATGNILTQGMISFSCSGSQGGTITLESGGAINTGILFSGAGDGDGGGVSLMANNDITVESINSLAFGSGRGGDILLMSTTGNIDTTQGLLDASSELGDGGNITLMAPGNLNTGSLSSQSNGVGVGGSILLESNSGNITTGEITFGSQGDVKGNLEVRGTGIIDLSTGIINNGGGITIGSDDLQSSTLFFPSRLSSNGNNITIFTQGDLVLEEPLLTTNGGQFSLFTAGTLSLSGMGNIQTAGGLIQITAAEIIGSQVNLNSSNLNGSAGNLSITAEGAGVTLANLDSSGETGGNITITAPGAITTERINSSGMMAGGNIELTSGGNIRLGDLSSNSTEATGGGVNINAVGDIRLSSMNTSGNSGGNISVTSATGNIVATGTLFSGSLEENGGNLSFSAPGNLNLEGDINTSARANASNVTLSSTGGNIVTTVINASSNEIGNGGTIILNAAEGLLTGDLFTQSPNFVGGAITLQSANQIIETGNLTTQGQGAGGSIFVAAQERITAGTLNSSSPGGNGGNVTLDPIGDIQVTAINASGGNVGGSVNIQTQQFFRATGTLTDIEGNNASISSVGRVAGGAITIQHGGGDTNPRTSFIVGDSSINGSAGTLTTGTTTLTPVQEFPGPFSEGNLALITRELPPESNVPPEPMTPIIPQSPVPNDGLGVPPGPGIGVPGLMIPNQNLTQSQELKVILNHNNFSSSQITSPPQPLNPNSILENANILPTLEGLESEIISVPGIETLEPIALLMETNPQKIAAELDRVEDQLTQEFIDHFELQNVTILDLEQVRQLLRQIEEQTGVKTALLYLNFVQPSNVSDSSEKVLQLLLVTADLEPILLQLPNVSQSEVLNTSQTWLSEITNPRRRESTNYLRQSQQLYQWFISPIVANLEEVGIDNLVFLSESGLRALPVAALHDGNEFIISKYSVGLMPSISLTNSRYQSVTDAKILAMGASEFEEQSPLPGVPLELSVIANTLWEGNSLLNPQFTLENLQAERNNYPFELIHLATHAEFQPGKPNNSYIQLWGDGKLTLDQMRLLQWDDPTVELLVLSACRTAVGDREAELGFAGLAIASGAKSALASLWYVSDQGTLGLMSEFYWQLRSLPINELFPIKAEAIRQAQLQMIAGNVKTESGQLFGSFGSIPLSAELAGAGDMVFSHPYFWSSFNLIGSPW